MKIQHDLHIHTNLSKCGKPSATGFAQITSAANDGIKLIGIANHMWDSSVQGCSEWYSKQNETHVLKFREELKSLQSFVDEKNIKVLVGCETEFYHDGKLGLSEENVSLFDFILAPHSHTHMPQVLDRESYGNHEKHAKYLMESFLRLIRHPLAKHFTAIAHPFAGGTIHANYNSIHKFIPDSYFKEAFCEVAEKNIGLEINGSTVVFHPENEIPDCEYRRIYSIAKSCSCRFSYGSDSHDPSEPRHLDRLENFLNLCGITDEDMIDFVK